MIVGRSMQLRAMEPEDLPLVLSWRNRPEVYNAFEEFDPISMPQQRAWYEKSLNQGNERNFIIALPDSDGARGKSIGLIALLNIHSRNRTAELGRLMVGDPSYSGSGVGVEAEALLLWYGFEQLNLHKIYLHVLAGNAPGICDLHQGLGFQHEAVLRQHVFKAGYYQDRLVMSMLVAEYREQKQRGLLGQLLKRTALCGNLF